MRGVRIEEAATVGAEHLDRFLRSHRAHCDGLLRDRRIDGHGVALRVLHRVALRIELRRRIRGGLQRRHVLVSLEVLDHALAHKDRGDNRGHRQKHIQRHTRDIDPEIADRLRGVACEAAHQCDHDDDASGRRQEVLHGETEHLRQIADRLLTRIVLPVRVRDEADRGVERTVRRHRAQLLRIAWQHALHAQDQIQECEAEHVERERHNRVLLPAHFSGRIDTRDAIQQLFERTEPAHDTRGAVHHTGDVARSRYRQRKQDHDKNRDLQDIIGVHSMSSARNSA
jgi:hypothetical protein